MGYFNLFFLTFLTSCAVQQEPPTGTFKNFKTQFLQRINLVRSLGCNCGEKYMPPVPPLSWNNNLEAAALKHAVDMARTKYFNHNSLSGKTVKQRVEASGYKLSGTRLYTLGENIAFNQRSIEQVMKSWMNSEGHCKNIMNKNYTEVGIAQFKYYWVQDFGMRKPL